MATGEKGSRGLKMKTSAAKPRRLPVHFNATLSKASDLDWLVPIWSISAKVWDRKLWLWL
jgi:hypothetical protein